MFKNNFNNGYIGVKINFCKYKYNLENLEDIKINSDKLQQLA